MKFHACVLKKFKVDEIARKNKIMEIQRNTITDSVALST